MPTQTGGAGSVASSGAGVPVPGLGELLLAPRAEGLHRCSPSQGCPQIEPMKWLNCGNPAPGCLDSICRAPVAGGTGGLSHSFYEGLEFGIAVE